MTEFSKKQVKFRDKSSWDWAFTGDSLSSAAHLKHVNKRITYPNFYEGLRFHVYQSQTTKRAETQQKQEIKVQL